MPTTSNFGWTTPADTDLVKDGAAAIRTLGNGIDTSLVDLKGGTTGQVLSKASNTDLDFTWSSVDPLTILDAKGDLISATAADTPARLAVGADGTYLQADSTTATGLKWGSVSAGGWTSIASGTLSSTSVSIQSISGTYYELVLFINNPYVNSATGMLVRINNDSNTVYSSNWIYADTTSWSNMSGKTGVNWWIGGGASGALPTSTSTLSGFMRMPNYAASTGYKVFELGGWGNTGNWGGGAGGIGLSHYEGGSGAIDRIDILTENGTSTFSGGTYALYGLK